MYKNLKEELKVNYKKQQKKYENKENMTRKEKKK
jgi:hypothetical protein